MTVEVFDGHACELGEGPVWDDRSGELIWVDILRAQVHRRALRTDAVRTTETFPDAVGCVALRDNGGWAMATAAGPALRSPGGDPQLVATYTDLDGAVPPTPVRGNDGGVDPAGRLWFGTIAWDMTPEVASLYRLDPHTGRTMRILSGVSVSNGLGWSPDGATMYFIDSPTRRIDAFDYDVATGNATRRRALAVMPEGAGLPDGCCVDHDGGVWVAMFGGGCVLRFTPDGTLDHRIDLPTPQVTSCAFVGADLDRLAVTTAAADLPDPDTVAGATFLADPGVRGLPVPRFAG